MLENRLLELVIVFLLVMMLFGAKRLPDTARALGKSLRILKSESRAMSEEARASELESRNGATAADSENAAYVAHATASHTTASHADAEAR